MDGAILGTVFHRLVGTLEKNQRGKINSKERWKWGGGGEVGECAVYYVKTNQQYPLLFDSDVSGLFVYLNVPSGMWIPVVFRGTQKYNI